MGIVTCPLAVNVDTFITYFFAHKRLLALPEHRIATAFDSSTTSNADLFDLLEP